MRLAPQPTFTLPAEDHTSQIDLALELGEIDEALHQIAAFRRSEAERADASQARLARRIASAAPSGDPRIVEAALRIAETIQGLSQSVLEILEGFPEAGTAVVEYQLVHDWNRVVRLMGVRRHLESEALASLLRALWQDDREGAAPLARMAMASGMALAH